MAWQRLSGVDALSLNTETRTTPAHTVVVIVMEPSGGIGHQRLHELVGSSLPRLARFRSRLVGKPLGLGQPVWGEASNFDPAPQLHRVAVPPPGGPGEFADLVAKFTTRPLVRDKPLWQAWSIEGLAGGRWALALKISQAMVGGVDGLALILARLLTVGPDDDPTSYPARRAEPGQVAVTGRTRHRHRRRTHREPVQHCTAGRRSGSRGVALGGEPAARRQWRRQASDVPHHVQRPVDPTARGGLRIDAAD